MKPVLYNPKAWDANMNPCLADSSNQCIALLLSISTSWYPYPNWQSASPFSAPPFSIWALSSVVASLYLFQSITEDIIVSFFAKIHLISSPIPIIDNYRKNFVIIFSLWTWPPAVPALYPTNHHCIYPSLLHLHHTQSCHLDHLSAILVPLHHLHLLVRPCETDFFLHFLQKKIVSLNIICIFALRNFRYGISVIQYKDLRKTTLWRINN